MTDGTMNRETPGAKGVLTAWGKGDTRKGTETPYHGITWEEICERAKAPTAQDKTAAQFIVPSLYRGPDGRTHAVQREQGRFPLLCLDVDTGSPSLEALRAALQAVLGPVECLIYSSSSASPEAQKWRALVPLAAPIPGADYRDTQEALFDLLARHGIKADPALARTGQPVYLPNVPPARRGADGKPLFYVQQHIEGARLQLAGSEIEARRAEMRALAIAEERAAEERRKAREIQRAEHRAATGDDFEPIEHFNSTHTIADLLARYGFERGRADSWRAPFQTSDSYALKDHGTHWTAVSGSYKTEGLGRSGENAQFGDAFDLFAHFEHGGDKKAAVRAYADEVRPQGNLDLSCFTPVQPEIEELPAMPADRARRLLKAEIEAGLRREGVTLIEATLGLGKTAAAIEALPALFAETEGQGAVVMAFPMHRLGRQVVEDIRKAAPGLTVRQLYGAEAKDPVNPEETVCKQLAEYQEHKALLLDTKDLCLSCPFAGECLHLQSINAHADIYVCSHERLKSSETPLHSDQTLLATIVDESPMNALVNASKRPVPLAALLAAPTEMQDGKQGLFADLRRLDGQADLEAFRDKLRDTIEAHGEGYLRLNALQGWTAADAHAARGLEWKRKISDPKHKDVQHNRTVTAAARLFGEIKRSIEEDLEENGRVKIQHGENGLEIVLSWLQPIGPLYRAAPVLMLDATAQPEIAAKLAGQELAHHVEIRAEERIEISQASDLSGAKSFFFGKGETTGNVERIRHLAVAHSWTEKTAVISNKETIKALNLPAEIPTAHFNNLRGLNDMADVDHLLVIGRPQPRPEAIARMVGAIWGTPCQGEMNPSGRAWRRIQDGARTKQAHTRATTHSDQRGDVILRQIRDAEVMQAIGRLRGVNRSTPARCTVISDAVLSYPVQLVEMRETIRRNATLGQMLERGVAFLSAAQAARAYPDLYASRQAAQKRWGAAADMTTFSIKGLYGKSCQVVEIHTPRAKEPAFALVAPWVEDAQAEIQRLLPAASVIEVVCPSMDGNKTQPVETEPVSLEAAPISTPPPQASAPVLHIEAPEWQAARDRHRERLRARARAALAPHQRILAAGIPIGGKLYQIALALHETSDLNLVADLTGYTAEQVEHDRVCLYVMGLIDEHNALDGKLKPRKLVWADPVASAVMERHVEGRRSRADRKAM